MHISNIILSFKCYRFDIFNTELMSILMLRIWATLKHLRNWNNHISSQWYETYRFFRQL